MAKDIRFKATVFWPAQIPLTEVIPFRYTLGYSETACYQQITMLYKYLYHIEYTVLNNKKSVLYIQTCEDHVFIIAMIWM